MLQRSYYLYSGIIIKRPMKKKDELTTADHPRLRHILVNIMMRRVIPTRPRLPENHPPNITHNSYLIISYHGVVVQVQPKIKHRHHHHHHRIKQGQLY